MQLGNRHLSRPVSLAPCHFWQTQDAHCNSLAGLLWRKEAVIDELQQAEGLGAVGMQEAACGQSNTDGTRHLLTLADRDPQAERSGLAGVGRELGRGTNPHKYPLGTAALQASPALPHLSGVYTQRNYPKNRLPQSQSVTRPALAASLPAFQACLSTPLPRSPSVPQRLTRRCRLPSSELAWSLRFAAVPAAHSSLSSSPRSRGDSRTTLVLPAGVTPSLHIRECLLFLVFRHPLSLPHSPNSRSDVSANAEVPPSVLTFSTVLCCTGLCGSLRLTVAAVLAEIAQRLAREGRAALLQHPHLRQHLRLLQLRHVRICRRVRIPWLIWWHFLCAPADSGGMEEGTAAGARRFRAWEVDRTSSARVAAPMLHHASTPGDDSTVSRRKQQDSAMRLPCQMRKLSF